MPRAYISVGSNINREKNVRSAVRALRKRFGAVILSRVYETRPVGFQGDSFYNLAVAVDTDEPMEDVASALRVIERQHDRRRGLDRFAPRTLDLDLLLYGDVVSERLPRREILQYAFVLCPLAEIAPELRDPASGKTYSDLWAEFSSQEELHPVDYRFED